MLESLVALSLAAQAADARPAFPGADGHGAMARGGRGGRIIPVTTLADTGPGSLRACLVARGPRVCVFRVAGVIRFTSRRPLIVNPYLTVAGESAPGGGIIVSNAGGRDGLTPIVVKNTHDIVIRHIRVRADRLSDSRSGNSAFTIENSSRILLDHVSGAWAQDQNLSFQGQNSRITVSNSIFAEGIPRHDKCALLASDATGPQRLSLLRSLCAHNGDRNPDANFPPGSCVEVSNNVLYNAQSQFAEIWESAGGTPISLTANIFRRGPNSTGAAVAIDRVLIASRGAARIHAAGNMVDGNMLLMNGLAEGARVAAPPCRPASRALPAPAAFRHVMQVAGALPRDAVDQRLVAETLARKGRIHARPGTMPVIPPAAPYPDADSDGMDDGWEAAHGANPARDDPWGDADGNGWANLEDFLALRHRQRVGDARRALPAAAADAALKGQRPAD